MSAITPSPHRLSSARWRGLRVGLLGGSFNPPHAGHMHIARQALIRFNLHAVWWVVSPGNPLKTKDTVKDYAARVRAVEDFVKDQPRMCATAIESTLHTRYTYDTLKRLITLFPQTHFVWIAGMDNACSFHKWDRWDALPALVPFVFFDRPPATSKIKGKPVRTHKGIQQHTKAVRPTLEDAPEGVFWMMRGRAVNLSSTMLRGKKLK